ncbi:MAG: hypothetical protein JNK86_03945 [Alphaproteobacteria bacterium]|nr:hypothetical protein [Alphaproteobacteria bacterium]
MRINQEDKNIQKTHLTKVLLYALGIMVTSVGLGACVLPPVEDDRPYSGDLSTDDENGVFDRLIIEEEPSEPQEEPEIPENPQPPV